MGIQTRDTNGKLHDTASLVALVGERLSAMPQYRANQYAGILGIDENTLMAMRRGIGGYASDYQRMMKTMGYNPTAAAKNANAFMTEFYKLKAVMGTAKDKIGGELARALTPSIEKLTSLILKHWPTIEKVIMSVVKAILTMSEMLGQLVYRGAKGIQDLIGWWKKLDEGCKNLIKTYSAMLAAWWALNAGFLASPIGIIMALAAALFLLYDDYQTWKEGGESLIDWSKWEPAINYALNALGELEETFSGLWGSVKELGKSFSGLWKSLSPLIAEFGKLIGIDFSQFSGQAFFDSLIKSIKNSITFLTYLVDAMRQVIDGDFSGALSSLKQAGGIVLDNTKSSIGFGLYNWANDKVNKYLFPEWLWGAPSKDNNQTSGKALLNSMSDTFTALEKRHNLPSGLLHGVAMTESAGNPKAIGPNTKYGTAKGLFQFIDSTAKGYGLTGNDVFDPHKSAEAAAKMLSSLLKTHSGDLDKALASYNWGIGNVQKIGMDKMPAETRNYIPKVRKNMNGTALAKNSSFNFDPRMLGNAMANIGNMLGHMDPKTLDNATANITNMLSHTGYTPKRLELLANNQPNQPTIEQHLTIHVSGVESPHEAAALTGEAVQRNNAILVRSLQTKMS
ncbi:lytic transglycosylase domain-containing protein [Xenorhabdus sp. XENO-10]|uniref:Lytic transglycosylase domain-containing protein n=1 Tax=Xenorhabdus yunnanensis TaxID=3025878 RepID=A0ABT5LNB0_9GAMM|nr:lytic transglycosylase domain-containing protein [Xenorhabdus yunnanensis]MDC9591270.1 lytic transglycosylase domain-containing protein [Xenorhabdus yunnanensis]